MRTACKMTPCRQGALVRAVAIQRRWRGKKNKQPQENHKTKMAVQETASQLSMALKVQEYPTLKVNRCVQRRSLIAR